MRYFRLLLILALLALPALAVAQTPTPSPDEFVPISQIPAEEQIPAINLVAAAYAFVWLGLIGYVWSLGRRLAKTEDDLARLERKGQ
ncbi:MAG: CcmD family protein [Vicinamibacterales bacterium]